MDDEAAFAMYFATIAGFQFHPRNSHHVVDLEKFADIAEQMVRLHRRRYPWVSLQRPLSGPDQVS